LQTNYKPTGTTHEVYGIKMYEAGHGKKALVIFSDIFGIDAGRHKAVADTFGMLGFNVFMPEMLSPPYTGAPGDFPKMSESIKQQKMATLEEKYEKLTKYMNINDHKKFLVLSMSWGSWFAFKMSAKYDNIKAIATVHPALMI
jgi:dienelactone hydrolase